MSTFASGKLLGTPLGDGQVLRVDVQLQVIRLIGAAANINQVLDLDFHILGYQLRPDVHACHDQTAWSFQAVLLLILESNLSPPYEETHQGKPEPTSIEL